MDASGILYYAIPGDHDLAQSVGATNFIKVFGNNYELVDVKGKKFLMVDNSANYTPLEFSTMTALTKDIPNVDFVLLSQPIFTDGLSVFFANKYMGSSSLLNDSNSVYKDSVQRLNDQRLQILSDLRSSKVSAVFVGDHHQSSTLVDSTKSSLKYFVVGAVSSTVNEFPQKIFQSSRFSVLTVFENGGYQTEEIVLE